MGDNFTFWGCTLLWIIASVATYAIGKTWTWLCGGKTVSKDHDPDRSFVQPIVFWRASVTAGLMTALLCCAMWMFVTYYAMLVLRSFEIYPDVIRDLGLTWEPKHRDQLEEVLGKPDRKGMRQRFMRAFTGSKDGLVESDSAHQAAKDYLKFEKDKKAIRALAIYLTSAVGLNGVGSPKLDSGGEKPQSGDAAADGGSKNQASFDADDLEAYFNKSLVPSSLEPVSSKQLLARLRQQPTKKEEFRAFHDRLEKKFDEARGTDLVVLSIMDRIRERVGEYHRVKLIFIGSIQFWTLFAYFLALILLAGRARLIDWQSKCPEWFVEYRRTKVEPMNLPWENSKETVLDDMFPEAGFTVCIKGYETQREKIRKGMAYLASHKQEPVDRFVLGALDRVYEALIHALKKGLSNAEAEAAARVVLNDLSERAEARVERVEYAAINYLLWALPSLGFIGTIVGIGDSLGKADQVVRASDALGRAEAITQVTSLLGFAFDTTLIALICGLPVMALLYAFRSRESQLILDIQQQIEKKLL